MGKEYTEFGELLGKTLTDVRVVKDSDDNDRMVFVVDDGSEYALYHSQDCCESVGINEIVGDLAHLVGSPITMADESGEESQGDDYSSTWTFYKLATIKGYVDIRWLGESNGYYSESVDFARIAGPVPEPARQ
jgi:hypothetical protein